MTLELTPSPHATDEARPTAGSRPEGRDAVLADYRIAYESRQASLLGRREVLTGKAKFGIFGDGKEVAQLAMARAFRPGDFRAGYYRDQTFMMARGILTLEEWFAQLYADTDVDHEPASAGRQMNGHYATRLLEGDGRFRDLSRLHNVAADLSPTASQMPKLVGLAYASHFYRQLPGLGEAAGTGSGGDEIAFGTIGDASCAEGLFWESINAAGVLQVPLLMSIWDDGYGISVPRELQITKGDLSAVLSGFGREPGQKGGYELFAVPAWDYPALCETYLAVAEIVRREHRPAIVHVTECTQPQGHSTSGSHERYKSPERLEWETQHDCLTRMRSFMVERGLAGEAELDELERQARERVQNAKAAAWKAYRAPIEEEMRTLVALTGELAKASPAREALEAATSALLKKPTPLRRDLMGTALEALAATVGEESPARQALAAWRQGELATNRRRYSSHLSAETAASALRVTPVAPVYAEDAPLLNGFEILNACFDAALARDPRVAAMGEDVGKLGDVNQAFLGMQEKYGALRVSDTGIREATIMGQAIGLAIRGLRPIAEIQYLDYLLYALQILSDDLATLCWRTVGQQKAPVIVRTRGHRLEGVWHSGSPMGGILHLVRGIHVCVPRDMTRAAGFYNTLLAADDPAIVIEVLNGYRTKEALPANIGEMRLPLGVPEILRQGTDVTVVSYGPCLKIAREAAEILSGLGIEMELIDVQTLLPFDLEHSIVRSLQKTNRILVLDEDVPGGASSYLMQQVLEEQGGYHWLDGAPRTLTSQAHRPAYASDGDYFSKPNREDVVEVVYSMMREADPRRFPPLV
ncbi:MAG TPA: thiamine pyrophosphate-dependent enzyme [Thermoanaerobaculia bacterium]|nr:thiamine pyrophosphate-dependent enzyme [Thermoanaerobaculia bacterium]